MTTASYNSNITIDGTVYKGANVVKMKAETNVPSYQTDQGFSIVDHLAPQPIEFSIDLTFYDEWGDDKTLSQNRNMQYNRLMQIRRERKSFTFISDFGTFEDMVITRFEPEQTDKSNNTFVVSLDIRQIVRATISLFSTPLIYDEDGALVNVGSVGGSGVEVALSVVDPLPENEKSWLEIIWDLATDW